MPQIVILGVDGRMGRALVRLAEEKSGITVAAGIDAHCDDTSFTFPVYKSLTDLDSGLKADVLIDFSHPDATAAAIPVCIEKKLPCVICTTGLDDAVKQALKEASVSIPVFYAANMSLGINLLAQLVKRAQRVLEGFDIEIIEKHHHNKLDAPSGTALLLADSINEEANDRYHYQYDRHAYRQKRNPDEIGIHAVRGGSIVGEHEVLFAGPDEVVSLSHTAYSRDVFANGALSAASYLYGKAPGLYSMDDMLASCL